MRLPNTLPAHLCAFGTTAVWGMTFISTKVLLGHHTPYEIVLYRFLLAVPVMFCMRPRIFRHGGGWRTELLFAGAGAFGVSVYFFFENVALTYTYASNASVIVCSAPFFTGVAARLFLGESLRPNFFAGFAVAISGIACIFLNGTEVLGLNPLGDCLAAGAAMSWAFYSVFTKRIFARGYPLLEATRRILLWGLVTLAAALPFQDAPLAPPALGEPAVLVNLLFLGVLASSVCFATWNYGLDVLGAVRATAYIYLTPVVTVVAAVILLDERLTPVSLAGIVLTLAGLAISERQGRLLPGGRRGGGGAV